MKSILTLTCLALSLIAGQLLAQEKTNSKSELKLPELSKDQYLGLSFNFYDLETELFSNVNRERYLLKPNGNSYYALSSAYKGLGLSVAFPTAEKSFEEYEATKSQDYQLSFNFSHLNLEIYHQNHRGLLIDQNLSTIGFSPDLKARRQAIKLTYFQEKKYLNGAKGDYFANRYKEKSGGYVDSSVSYSLIYDRYSLQGLDSKASRSLIASSILNGLENYQVDSLGFELGASLLLGYEQIFFQPQITLGPALQQFHYTENGQENQKNKFGLSTSAGAIIGGFIGKHLLYFDFKYHSLSYTNPTLNAKHRSSGGGLGYKYFF